jgi:hypothetical protein
LELLLFAGLFGKTKIKACFKNKLISSPVSLICYMCAFLCYWVGLQEETNKQILLEGAERLQRRATSAHDATRVTSIRIRKIQGQDEEEEKLMSWETNHLGKFDDKMPVDSY